MKAMLLAAGLGTRLRPLTDTLPKPMMPVLDRPLMEHVVDLCMRQGFDELVANVHHLPDAIRSHFGDRLEYRYEPELLGTAGGVRNARDFFGDQTMVVVSGDNLTDIDLNALVDAHRAAGGVATLSVKRLDDTRGLGVVLADSSGRVIGFQEKPHPDEALSDLANCAMYCFEPEVFEYFPDVPAPDWALDVFPALLENDVPFHVHEIDAYYNDIGTSEALRRGTFDALDGRVHIETETDGPVWVGDDAKIGEDVRFDGHCAIGAHASIGRGASLRDSIVFPGATVNAGARFSDAVVA